MSKARRQKQTGQDRKREGASGRNQPCFHIDRRIAAMARDNVMAIIGQGRVKARALELATSAFFLADHLVNQFEAANPLPRPIVCQAGCSFCCFNQVELTPPEALLLGDYIERNFSEVEKRALLAHVARNLALTAGKSKVAIAAMRQELPCPLLRDQKCSVHPVRPLVCRAMHALEAAQCEAELRSGSLTGSPCYSHRHEIALSVSAGLRDGCQSLGCQATALNLARALQDFFAQEDAAQRWINGENTFGAGGEVGKGPSGSEP